MNTDELVRPVGAGQQEAIIALGSNLGSSAGGRRETLQAALSALRSEGLPVRRVSRFFATPAFPAGAGPDYVNACAALAPGLAPHEILARLHAVEAAFGRDRAQRWGSRSLDLDLIACGDAVLPDPATQRRWRALPPDRHAVDAPDTLVLPHPRLAERAFVLVPMADIAAGWTHPATGRSVPDMLDDLPPAERAAVRPV